MARARLRSRASPSIRAASASGEGFVAIRGPNRDGHAFVAAALDQGAACAIVDGTFPPGDEERLVRVGETLEALNDLGRASRARATHTKVIAVTGSAGKTGTKEALRLALAPSGSVHASAKSFNNHWGVPLSLANMPKTVTYGVFEIGMNHAGEIDVLTRLVRPEIAIVTTVAPVHLGFFRSVEEIADAKAEIFHGLESGGVAVINRDSPYYERLKARALEYGARIVGFGEAQGAEVRLLGVALEPDGSEVNADILGETLNYRLGAPGRHLVQNSLAVLAAAKLAGADLERAAAALEGLRRKPGAARARLSRARVGASPSSTNPIMPIRPRCGPRWRRWGSRRGMTSPVAWRCSATCWNSAPKAPDCIRSSPSSLTGPG